MGGPPPPPGMAPGFFPSGPVLPPGVKPKAVFKPKTKLKKLPWKKIEPIKIKGTVIAFY